MRTSNAYEQVHTTDLEGRALEASILLRAVQKLNWCAKQWDQQGTPEFSDRLQDALAFTQRIWTFLQLEVAHPDHHLPGPVRQSVFRLSRYVDQTITKLYAGGSLRELQSLIALNREIAAGLSQAVTPDSIAGGAPPQMSAPATRWG